MHTPETSLFRNTDRQDTMLKPSPLWRQHQRSLGIAVILFAALPFLLPEWLNKADAGTSVASSRILVSSVERGPFVRDVVADGKVVAAGSSTLHATAHGTVRLLVAPGDTVQREELLGRIESAELDAQLAIERATLDAYVLNLERAHFEARRAETHCRHAWAQADFEYRSAQREYDRAREAAEKGVYAEIHLARASDTLELARFALAEAEQMLASQPEQTALDIRDKEVLMQRQQLRVADLERQVQALQVRSPVDGMVGQVLVSSRASVTRDTPLLTVVDLSRLMVEIQVPENFARDLVPGMQAELGGSQRSWPGVLDTVSPEVVDGQVTARVAFAGPQPERMRQSQRLSVRVLIEHREDVLSVERGSFFNRGSAHAWRIDSDGLARRIPARFGTASLARVEVLDGLAEGDQIVIAGAEAFGAADSVQLTR